MKKLNFYILLFSLLSIYNCNNKSKEKTKVIITVNEKKYIDYETSLLIKNQLKDVDTSETIVIANDSLFATTFILNFYKRDNYKSVWFKEGISTRLCDSLYKIIKNSDEYGLIQNDYHTTKIDSLIHLKNVINKQQINIDAVTEAELLLTDAFYTFCVHVSKGRLNKDSLTREWKGKQMDSAFVNLLYLGIEKNNIRSVIDSLEPKNSEYKAFKLALKKFKNEFKDAYWDSIFYKSKDSLTYKEHLKKRLIASHDYYEEYTGSSDIKLIKAIKNFQCRHNLTEDGKVGKLTYIALQKTKQDYIQQIEVNMERWRYYSKPKEKAYVWINIPKFEMRVIEEDSIIIKSRIIVGNDTTPTPILHSTIQYFLIYPYWNVPYKIATKEILPILKKNKNYLENKNFEVLDKTNHVVDTPIYWENYHENYFPWKIRQRIGDDNALGILKFYFNNKQNVYMHDTDSRRLFNLENRALSHGCIRLEKFIDFAMYLIKEDSIKYPVDSLKHDFLKEQQKYIYLKHPLPIYINYFTIEITKNDELIYLEDIYKKDEKMIRSLYKKVK